MPRDAPVMATILPGSRFEPAMPGFVVVVAAAAPAAATTTEELIVSCIVDPLIRLLSLLPEQKSQLVQVQLLQYDP